MEFRKTENTAEHVETKCENTNRNKDNLTAHDNDDIYSQKRIGEKYFHFFVPVIRRISCAFGKDLQTCIAKKTSIWRTQHPYRYSSRLNK
ncbi:hypothetical protein [Methanosarcina barkeri]|uniref:hypothetical protein n=1 Tax=Methanosarcina barkeri TaxID=2208 RepID=UPI00064E8CE0|nr:hypothetical protein [Methanosarcina barkeri]